jgi:hypothetical protein
MSMGLERYSSMPAAKQLRDRLDGVRVRATLGMCGADRQPGLCGPHRRGSGGSRSGRHLGHLAVHDTSQSHPGDASTAARPVATTVQYGPGEQGIHRRDLVNLVVLGQQVRKGRTATRGRHGSAAVALGTVTRPTGGRRQRTVHQKVEPGRVAVHADLAAMIRPDVWRWRPRPVRRTAGDRSMPGRKLESARELGGNAEPVSTTLKRITSPSRSVQRRRGAQCCPLRELDGVADQIGENWRRRTARQGSCAHRRPRRRRVQAFSPARCAKTSTTSRGCA